MPKLTVHEFLRCKGQRQLTQTFTKKSEEAAAFNAVGLDVIVTMAATVPEIRKAAPDVFLVGVPSFNESAESDANAIRLGLWAVGRMRFTAGVMTCDGSKQCLGQQFR